MVPVLESVDCTLPQCHRYYSHVAWQRLIHLQTTSLTHRLTNPPSYLDSIAESHLLFFFGGGGGGVWWGVRQTGWRVTCFECRVTQGVKPPFEKYAHTLYRACLNAGGTIFGRVGRDKFSAVKDERG